MTNQIIALLDGRRVGTVHYKNARLSFVYGDTWRADPNRRVFESKTMPNYAQSLRNGLMEPYGTSPLSHLSHCK